MHIYQGKPTIVSAHQTKQTTVRLTLEWLIPYCLQLQEQHERHLPRELLHEYQFPFRFFFPGVPL
jgi:hypothetical protein